MRTEQLREPDGIEPWSGWGCRRRSLGLLTILASVGVPLAGLPRAQAATNTWGLVASMSTPRWGLGAATGGDGRIYAIGGTSDGTTPLATVEAYTPSTNSWTSVTGSGSVAPMFTARFGLAAAAGSDGRIYAIGGTDGTNILDSVEAYTPWSNTWTLVHALPEPTRDAAAVSGPDGRIYLIGGLAVSSPGGSPTTTDAVLAYTPDPTGGPGGWTPASGAGALTPMSMPRSSLGATTGSDGLIYALGGFASGSTGRLSSVEAYDTQMNYWVPAPPMSESRAGLAAATGSGGDMVALGPDSTAEEYAPATSAWSSLAGMSTSRAEPAVATGPSGDGRVYAIGGYDASHSGLSSVEAYAYPATSLFTGDASAVYFSGVTLGAGSARVTLPDGSQHICEASVSSPTAVGTTTGTGYPGCQGLQTGQGPAAADPIVYNPTGAATPAAVLAVNQETVTTQGTMTNGSSTSTSRMDSISLLPGAVVGSGPGPGTDVLDATTVIAGSSASCASGASGHAYASSQIGSLTIDGTTVATQPVGSSIVFNPTGKDPVTVHGDPIWVNPTGGRIPMAIVTLSYSRYDLTGNTVLSSPAAVEFPAGGPLSSVIVGKVFLSYAQSGMVGCHA